MRKYTELSVLTTHEGAEIVSDVLWDYTDEGVSVFDRTDVSDFAKNDKTWNYIDEKVLTNDDTVIVKVCFPKEKSEEYISEIERKLLRLKQSGEIDFGTLQTVKREIDADAWIEKWKENFKPIKIGKITVVPAWVEHTPEKDEKTVVIGSDTAFGTGEHETTAMCIEYLGKYVEGKETVLDVGCGSGILGIAAEKLGAEKVVMTDIDENAVKAAKLNSEINRTENCSVILKNLLDDNSVKGDIIVINIIAEVLIAFSEEIGKNLNPGGKIILSGILKDRLDKVVKAYEEAGFIYVESNIRGEWAAVVFKDGR